MNKATDTYRPTSNGMIVGLLVLIMLGFGLVAESSGHDEASPLVHAKSYICSQVLSGWCDQIAQTRLTTHTQLLLR